MLVVAVLSQTALVLSVQSVTAFYHRHDIMHWRRYFIIFHLYADQQETHLPTHILSLALSHLGKNKHSNTG